MSSRITPARFRSIIASGMVVLLILCLSACARTPTPPPLPQLTQLQIRAMQTREYASVGETLVLKATIAALLDAGFIINTADHSIGLITAAKEVYDVDEATKKVAEFNWGSGSGTYQTTIRFEASGVIRSYAGGVQVRISIVQKSVSNSGGNIWSQPLYDPAVYQTIFSKVDKAVFLERENL